MPEAIEHIRRMRGGAQAHLMRCDDSRYYIVKFQNNPQHIRILANELLATRMAARLGLSVPESAAVLVSAASGDLWSDARGSFLSVVAAGPVYRLLGKPDLGTMEMPALDTPVVTGTLGYLENKGPHVISDLDWKTFLDFADRHLQPKR